MANDDEKRDRPQRRRWPGLDVGGGSNRADPQQERTRRTRLILWLLLGVLASVWLFRGLGGQSSEEVSYSRFLQLIREGNKALTDVRVGDTRVEGIHHHGGLEDPIFAVKPPIEDQGQLSQLLDENDIDYTGSVPSGLTNFLLSLIPTILVLGLLYWLFIRRVGAAGATALQLGRNRVRIYDRKEMKTNFADVAGLDEAVEELREVVDFLKNPKKYQRLGGRIPKGVLLLGPPGCGKTLLARAVAGEANVPFFFMSGSEFVEMFVGLGAARVRELFQQAKEKAPALVFLDEIDTIGKGRGGGLAGSFGSHDEREQTLNQLLVEMDGFDSQKGVIIMAATNRPDVLDPALVRPGRFDRQVIVDRPDLRGREAILKVHARGVALDPAVDMHVIAARTPGFTGADLANVVNEAALLAARREKNSVTAMELEEAIDRVVGGLERKSRVIGEKQREIVAVHEMGHALVALSSPRADPVHRVSIIPRGAAALGMTMQRPLEDRYLLQEPELHVRLAILLGGRTAEEIMFDQASTGAQDDLQRATDIARAMVVEYGMSEKLGPLSYGRDGFHSAEGRPLFPGERPEMSDATAAMVDAEVSRLVHDAQAQARQILTGKRDLLDRLSRLLMATEVIEGHDLLDYVNGTRPIPEPEDAEAAEAARTQELSGPQIVPAPAE